MVQYLVAEQLGQHSDLKSYSCLTCRQRKVKCDRRTPCSNCIKSEKQCGFTPPVRGKRKRTKPPRESLHAKLKRYEELLKLYGAKVELSEAFDDSDSETVSQPDVDMDEDSLSRRKSRSEPIELEETKPKLITKEGTSRYFDRYVCLLFHFRRSLQLLKSLSAPWSNLGDEVGAHFLFLIPNNFFL